MHSLVPARPGFTGAVTVQPAVVPTPVDIERASSLLYEYFVAVVRASVAFAPPHSTPRGVAASTEIHIFVYVLRLFLPILPSLLVSTAARWVGYSRQIGAERSSTSVGRLSELSRLFFSDKWLPFTLGDW